jgi:pyruvate formate lyase activating enzyme
VLPLVDWVGLDIKAPFDAYARVTAAPGSGQRARESLEQVLAAGVEHEIRTTVHPALLADGEVEEIAHDLSARGVQRYVIQAFRSQGCRDEGLCQATLRAYPLAQLQAKVASLFEKA